MPRRRRISARAVSIDSRNPVVVHMHVECAGCGHTADETYEFDMPFAKSKPMESCESGECPECGAPGANVLEVDAAAAVGR
jgi:hypothetical protein